MDPEKSQLLELNLISAQKLKNPSNLRRFQSYAVAWIDPKSKLRTRIDTVGKENPTWNDKFIFAAPGWFLSSENSAIMVEIYTVGYLRDTLAGSVRVLIGNLPNSGNPAFTALQIRRPSGRFHGVLNLGLMVLDNSLPLTASAIGYRDLMGENMGARRRESFGGKIEKSGKYSSNDSVKKALKVWNDANDDDDGDGALGVGVDLTALKFWNDAINGRTVGEETEKTDICEKGKTVDGGDGDGGGVDFVSRMVCGERFDLGMGNGILCGLIFQRKNSGDSKIHLSPSDQNLQISIKDGASETNELKPRTNLS